jgi:hypothetical protein
MIITILLLPLGHISFSNRHHARRMYVDKADEDTEHPRWSMFQAHRSSKLRLSLKRPWSCCKKYKIKTMITDWEHQKPSSVPFSISGWAILALSLRITRGRCASSRCCKRLLQRRLLLHSAVERYPVPMLIDMDPNWRGVGERMVGRGVRCVVA